MLGGSLCGGGLGDLEPGPPEASTAFSIPFSRRDGSPCGAGSVAPSVRGARGRLWVGSVISSIGETSKYRLDICRIFPGIIPDRLDFGNGEGLRVGCVGVMHASASAFQGLRGVWKIAVTVPCITNHENLLYTQGDLDSSRASLPVVASLAGTRLRLASRPPQIAAIRSLPREVSWYVRRLAGLPDQPVARN